jgi:uncharacterized membrane protein YfcA
MAKVLGEAGRYASHEAVKERQRTFLLVCILTGVFGCIEGFLISTFVPTGWVPGWLKLFGIAGALIAVYLLLKWGDRKLREAERRRVRCCEVHMAKNRSVKRSPIFQTNFT